MCGRFALTCDSSFYERFSIIDSRAECITRYNIAPTQQVPIIIKESPNHSVLMRWGLIPFWAKDEKIGNRMINARAETARTRSAYRVPMKDRRCIVPATGFYEWKKKEKRKIPYFIRMKDGDYFGMAGLYDRWKNREGKEILSFTILTTRPNSLAGKIHDRMPVILRREDEETWLEKRPLDQSVYEGIIAPYPSKEMESYQVSLMVNVPSNDRKELIEPV